MFLKDSTIPGPDHAVEYKATGPADHHASISGLSPSCSPATVLPASTWAFALSSLLTCPANIAKTPRSYAAFIEPPMTNATQNKFFPIRNPVIDGPMLEVNVLTILRVPITAVRSFGSSIAARNADLGAVSIDWVQDRSIRKNIAGPTVDGTGIRARKIADGRWVKTIVCVKSASNHESEIAPDRDAP